MSCLYILDTNALSVIFANIFFHSKGCVFILLMVSFAVQKLLSLIRPHLFIFAFISFALEDRSKKIDLIISDNRYGVFSKKARSIFVTHQIQIKSPIKNVLINKLINRINLSLIENFNQCFIPDTEGDFSLSGELSESKNLKIKVQRIGILSRFERREKVRQKDKDLSENKNKYSILAILSGPEPQRSIFEKIIKEQSLLIDREVLILQGRPDLYTNKRIKNIQLISHLDKEKLEDAIKRAEIIISRAGYSTVMDLVYLEKSAILVPTPAQTEQEYIGKRLADKGLFVCCEQTEFDLKKAIKKYEEQKNTFEYKVSKDKLKQILINIINESL